MADTLGYPELADRITATIGIRPARSTLRAAVSRPKPTPSRGRPSITAGMPQPLPSDRPTQPARFDTAQVERWLANHPLLAWNRAVTTAREQLAAGREVEQVIAEARSHGLPWRTITELVGSAQDVPTTVAGVHKKYRQPPEGFQ